jgi:hypothetical protein
MLDEGNATLAEPPLRITDTPAVRAPRGRLGAYALWQLRDFAVERSLPILLIAAVMTYLVTRSHNYRYISPAELLAQILAPTVGVGMLLVTHDMVSADRKMGYFRFLFAKPVSVARYYAQLFAVKSLGFLATIAVVVALFSLLVQPVAPFGVLGAVAVMFLCIGGIGFLLSTVTRHDSLWMLALLAGTGFLRGIENRLDSVYQALIVLLPPIHRFPAVIAWFIANLDPMKRGRLLDVVWVAGYGLAAFGLGLFLLRRRSIVA